MNRSDPFAGTMVGAIVLAFFLILLLCYIAVKAIELAIRIITAHPQCKPVWISLITMIGLIVSAVVTQGQITLLNTLALTACMLCVFTLKSAEVYYNEKIEKEIDKQSLRDDVLHQPWWSLRAA